MSLQYDWAFRKLGNEALAIGANWPFAVAREPYKHTAVISSSACKRYSSGSKLYHFTEAYPRKQAAFVTLFGDSFKSDSVQRETLVKSSRCLGPANDRFVGLVMG